MIFLVIAVLPAFPISAGLTSDFLPLSLDHFVRPRQHVGWDREANLLGGFEIDDEFEIPRGFNRQFLRLGPFQNAVNVPGTSLPQSVSVRTVVQESPELSYRRRTAAEQCDLLLN